MADNETPTTPTEDHLPEDANVAQVREALNRERERRREVESSVTDLATLRRENAFLKAGVPSDTPLGSVFAKGYDGELDPEAIKTAWDLIAPSAQTPPETPPETPQTEEPPSGLTAEQQEELRRLRSGLGADSSPPGSEPKTAIGMDIMNAAYETQGGVRARPPEGMNDRAMNAGFSRLFARANDNDQEAIFKRPNETWADATERWRATKS